MLGGIGTGKSTTIAIWVISKIAMHPGCSILLAANTYQQLITATIKSFTDTLDLMGIPYIATLSGSKKRIQIGRSSVLLYSLENYDNIRGIEVDYVAIDEACYAKYEAIQVVRGRLRGKFTENHQILYCSSPNGFNWAYDLHNSNSRNKLTIQAHTKDNIFLPSDYFDRLVEFYGGINSPLARQELFGEFVNLQSGAIYNLFDRNINVLEKSLDKRLVVHVGLDFNIDQMNAVLVQFYGNEAYVCKEIKLTHRNANTHDLGVKLLEELKGYLFQVYPDSTGSARKSCSTKSDHQILKDLGIPVMVTQNPLVRDRQNTVNYRFLKKKLFIDKSCVNLIKEIETLSSRDREGEVSHLGPALGYVMWSIDPLSPKLIPSRTISNF